jgi:hypothetical protein
MAMSYDIRGRNPSIAEGEHFYAALLEWPMLVEVLLEFAPEQCRSCEEWFGEFCYGCGLDAEQARKLAAKLKLHLCDQTIPAYVAEHFHDRETHWLSIGAVHDFVLFLESCGGFYIS